MKKLLCSLIAVFMLLTCFGCNAQGNSKNDDKDYMLDLKVFYVDSNEIKSTEERLECSTQKEVIEKWLTLNGLDDSFDLIGSYINKGDIELSETSETTKNEFTYVYNDIYEYYFNADINEFLEKPENALYADSLKSTLDYAFDKIAKQNWADDYLAQRITE